MEIKSFSSLIIKKGIEAVAKNLCVSEQQVEDWYNGEPLPLDMAVKISKIFKIELKNLVDGVLTVNREGKPVFEKDVLEFVKELKTVKKSDLIAGLGVGWNDADSILMYLNEELCVLEESSKSGRKVLVDKIEEVLNKNEPKD